MIVAAGDSERELAIFRDSKYLFVARNFPEKIWFADLHLTDRRIYATPTTQTPERYLPEVERFSVPYSQMTVIKLRSNRGLPYIHFGWKFGPRFWNRDAMAFELTNESFQAAKAVLPTIPQLAKILITS